MIVRARDILILILLGALVFFVYRDYAANRDLERICALLGSHVAVSVPPQTPRQEIDNLCRCSITAQADYPNEGCPAFRKYYRPND
jgi:hypothetical protein